MVRVCLLDGDGTGLSSLQGAAAAAKEVRMDQVYHFYGIAPICGVPLFAPRWLSGEDHVLGVPHRKFALLCGWHRIGIRVQGQPGFLQIHMPDYRIHETHELFFHAPDNMRCKQMHLLWQVQARMPNGCGCNGQFKEAEERDRVYSMLGMCTALPKGCFVDGRCAFGGKGVLDKSVVWKTEDILTGGEAKWLIILL